LSIIINLSELNRSRSAVRIRKKISRRNTCKALGLPYTQTFPIKLLNDFGGQNSLELSTIGIRLITISIDIPPPTDTRNIGGTELVFPRPGLFALMVFKGFI
jgi:hypothetical protein